MADEAEYRPKAPRRRGKEPAGHEDRYDLRQDLDYRAGRTRSIYGSRGYSPPLDGTDTGLGSTTTIEAGNSTGPDIPPIVGMT